MSVLLAAILTSWMLTITASKNYLAVSIPTEFAAAAFHHFPSATAIVSSMDVFSTTLKAVSAAILGSSSVTSFVVFPTATNSLASLVSAA